MIKHVLLASILTFSSTYSFADKCGSTCEGALYGAGGLLVLQHIFKSRNEYTPPPPVYTSSYPNSGSAIDPVREAYEAGVKEREREELAKRQEWAYQCGRYGKYCDKL